MSAIVYGPYQGKRLKGRTVAQLYAEGQRNFGGAILRGANLQGQMLSQADFSGADIRGANFERAVLQKVDFSHAKGGLQRRWWLTKLIVVLVLAAAIGFITTELAIPVAGAALKNHDPMQVFGAILLGLCVVIPAVLILAPNLLYRFALGVAGDNAGNLLIMSAISFSVAVVMVLVLLQNPSTAVSVRDAVWGIDQVLVMFFVACLIASAGFSVADTNSGILEFGDWLGNILVILAGLGGVILGAEDSFQLSRDRVVPLEIVMAVVGVMFGLVMFFGNYTYRWLGQGTQQPSPLRDCGLRLTTLGGTSFSGADLTGATFARASLKHTRFVPTQQPTILTNVRWQNTKYRGLAWFAHPAQP